MVKYDENQVSQSQCNGTPILLSKRVFTPPPPPLRQNFVWTAPASGRGFPNTTRISIDIKTLDQIFESTKGFRISDQGYHSVSPKMTQITRYLPRYSRSLQRLFFHHNVKRSPWEPLKSKVENNIEFPLSVLYEQTDKVKRLHLFGVWLEIENMFENIAKGPTDPRVECFC